MRLCILGDRYEGSDSPMAAHDTPGDPTPHLSAHTCETHWLTKRTAVRSVIQLARQGFDAFVNLCDGAWDEDRPGIEVVQALERLDQAFTGAESGFYEPSREAMKRVCRAWGIDTPGYVFARTEADLERALDTLRFPLFVKHPSSYSSIGLTRASRVTTAAELREQAGRMIGGFGEALIEEFVEGREFTTLVAEDPERPDEPVVYVPVEIRFPPGDTFKHFDLKWIDFEGMDCVPVEDPELDARLRRISRDFFVGLRGSGYGRCDVRMDSYGRLQMLEINPNCGVFYPLTDPGSADMILQLDPEGHRGFAERIVRTAVARREPRRGAWEVRGGRDGEYGTFARRAIAAGEMIERYQESPHWLVTRDHVERAWDARRKAWFAAYAWPLTDEVWVTWSPDPEGWRPINHACDPNAWLEGLDLVARRAIAPGEEITMDYATFCVQTMPEFACRCGAAECRKVIRGTDHLEPFVERYGRHVSPFVRRRREGGAA